MSARYLVRRGKVREKGDYLTIRGFTTWQAGAWHMTHEEAVERAAEVGGRVVRLLSPAEGRDRHASTVLRAEADKHIKVAEALVMGRISGRFVREGRLTVAYALLDEADRLWPPKPPKLPKPSAGAKRAGGRGR